MWKPTYVQKEVTTVYLTGIVVCVLTIDTVSSGVNAIYAPCWVILSYHCSCPSKHVLVDGFDTIDGADLPDRNYC